MQSKKQSKNNPLKARPRRKRITVVSGGAGPSQRGDDYLLGKEKARGWRHETHRRKGGGRVKKKVDHMSAAGFTIF